MVWVMIKKSILKYGMKVTFSGSLMVFNYHKIPLLASDSLFNEVHACEFEEILDDYLEWFNFLRLDEAVERLQRRSLPPHAAVMTFDDGYAEWFDHLVPLLQKHRIPATFFITTSQIDRGVPFWHDRIAAAISFRSGKFLPHGFDWGEAQLGETPEAIAQSIIKVQEKVKYLNVAEREAVIASLEVGVQKNESFRPFKISDVVRLHDAGFQIGGHSRLHPILTRCTEKEAFDEISGCKEDLEVILREPVTAFAYPNGRPGLDYGPEHVRLVKSAGYRLAVTTSCGVATSETDIYQLPRYAPWGHSSWRRAWQLVKNLHVKPKLVGEEQGL